MIHFYFFWSHLAGAEIQKGAAMTLAHIYILFILLTIL